MSGKDTFRHEKFFNKGTKQWQDMVGSTFGRLTVVKKEEQREYRDGSTKAVWECLCICGKSVQRLHSCLTQRQTISCGCWKAEQVSIRQRKPDTAFQDLWHSYRKGARERGLEWDLTEEHFRVLTSSPCYFTGRPPMQEARSCASNRRAKRGLEELPGGVYLFNGIDRLDNAEGYTKENCVPCCAEVNFAKGTMNQKDFINLCKEVAQQH